MAELVGIVDTGVFCCWLQVPGRETAGSHPDYWDNARAHREIDDVVRQQGTLIVPSAVIVEVGRHIAQATHSRHHVATRFMDFVVASKEGVTPWREFDESDRLWNLEWAKIARVEWPDLAAGGFSIADYSLKYIADYFASVGSRVKILSTEAALRAHQTHPIDAGLRRRRPR